MIDLLYAFWWVWVKGRLAVRLYGYPHRQAGDRRVERTSVGGVEFVGPQVMLRGGLQLPCYVMVCVFMFLFFWGGGVCRNVKCERVCGCALLTGP